MELGLVTVDALLIIIEGRDDGRAFSCGMAFLVALVAFHVGASSFTSPAGFSLSTTPLACRCADFSWFASTWNEVVAWWCWVVPSLATVVGVVPPASLVILDAATHFVDSWMLGRRRALQPLYRLKDLVPVTQ